MPPRLPVKARSLQRITTEPWVCASCLLNPGSSATKPGFPQKRRKIGSVRSFRIHAPNSRNDEQRNCFKVATRSYASNGSLASATAINAPTVVPQAHRELYQSLAVLQEIASSYVDLSRLQLAMRSLESESPIIRVALLGLGSNGAFAARRLARALLCDALSEEEVWEQEILDSATDGRSLLIQYGDTEQPTPANSLLRTMHVPSRYLAQHKLEILITSFNAGPGSTPNGDLAAVEEAVLVPPLTTPNSPEGRMAFVRYPVHKAVVVAEGVSGAVEYGRFPDTLTAAGLVNAALVVPLRASSGAVRGEHAESSKTVDVDLAQDGLDRFRENKANGAEFNEKWQNSRISPLSDWITGNRGSSSVSNPSPPVQKLITSILTSASTSISVSEDAERALALANTVPDPKRAALQTAVSEWSAAAHRDLQDNLDNAFYNSDSWRRTAWWRLFWRIDDVTVSASDLLRSRWLTEAEQNLAFLSGRILDSGLANSVQLSTPPAMLLSEEQAAEMAKYEAEKSQTEAVAELKQTPSVLSRVQPGGGIHALILPPWPQTIALSRQYMLHTLVPELHRKAQALLVTALTTIGGSSALGAWFFAATAGHGLYEAGAIIALGLVWSLRRLQKKWGQSRELFASSVREDARKVLGEVEAHLRGIVRNGGRAMVRPEDERSWTEARQAVESCRLALEDLRPKN